MFMSNGSTSVAVLTSYIEFLVFLNRLAAARAYTIPIHLADVVARADAELKTLANATSEGELARRRALANVKTDAADRLARLEAA